MCKISCCITEDLLGNHIKGQLIRCSTSVAANYRAACHGQTKAVFIHKIGIVIEEADVRQLADWLEFIIDENLKPKEVIEDLKNEAYELASIFIKSRQTAQKNL